MLTGLRPVTSNFCLVGLPYTWFHSCNPTKGASKYQRKPESEMSMHRLFLSLFSWQYGRIIISVPFPTFQAGSIQGGLRDDEKGVCHFTSVGLLSMAILYRSPFGHERTTGHTERRLQKNFLTRESPFFNYHVSVVDGRCQQETRKSSGQSSFTQTSRAYEEVI